MAFDFNFNPNIVSDAVADMRNESYKQFRKLSKQRELDVPSSYEETIFPEMVDDIDEHLASQLKDQINAANSIAESAKAIAESSMRQVDSLQKQLDLLNSSVKDQLVLNTQSSVSSDKRSTVAIILSIVVPVFVAILSWILQKYL